MNEAKLEDFLRENILPEIEKGRGGFDGIHTLEVVDWVKKILDHNLELKLDRTVMIIAAYAHDWGYSSIFKDGEVMNYDLIESAKTLHMELGAKKLDELLKDKFFDFLGDEQKDRCVHLVAVHDKKYEIDKTDELVLMEADVLSGLDINGNKPILDKQSNEKFLDSILNIRLPKFITEYSKKEAAKLIEKRAEFFKKRM